MKAILNLKPHRCIVGYHDPQCLRFVAPGLTSELEMACICSLCVLGTAAWKLTFEMVEEAEEVKRAVMLTMSGRAGLVVGVRVMRRPCLS